MTLRELQNQVHKLRPYSIRICQIASLTEVKLRAAPEGIVVIAGWGTGQLQIIITVRELCGRPCDDSREIARRILYERTGNKETTDARNSIDLVAGPEPAPGGTSTSS